MNSFVDYYNILGLRDDASRDDIKRAFRKLAKEWHPDARKHPRVKSTKRFAQISTAYEILSDPEKRKKYDSYKNFSQSYSKQSSYGKEWEDLSRWFQEIYEKHLSKADIKAKLFLSRIRRGFIGAAIGLSIGISFRAAALPLMVLGWFFGYYLFKGQAKS